MNPLVSIIIPTYNRAHLIGKTLLSVQNQTFPDWECIVIDDGSADDTEEVVKKFSMKDPRFRYLKNERKKGAQGARNTGIIHARYPWIAFNDSDDEWLPERLALQIPVLAANGFNPFLVVHGNCLVYDNKKGSKEEWKLNPIEGKKPLKTFLKDSSILIPGMITSKKALELIGYLDENVKSYQEWDTAIQLSRFCDFIHIPKPLFIYYKHEGETISKDINRDIEGANFIHLKYHDDFIHFYGAGEYSTFLLKNIRRVIPYGYWNTGIDLLKKSRKFIPAKTLLNWYVCFSLKVDPMKRNEIPSKLFKRLKQKLQ